MSALLRDSPRSALPRSTGCCRGRVWAWRSLPDLRLAADSAAFTTAFAKVGFAGDFGITWPLTRALGEASGRRMLFLSDVLSAPQAANLGLLNRVLSAAS